MLDAAQPHALRAEAAGTTRRGCEVDVGREPRDARRRARPPRPATWPGPRATRRVPATSWSFGQRRRNQHDDAHLAVATVDEDRPAVDQRGHLREPAHGGDPEVARQHRGVAGQSPTRGHHRRRDVHRRLVDRRRLDRHEHHRVATVVRGQGLVDGTDDHAHGPTRRRAEPDTDELTGQRRTRRASPPPPTTRRPRSRQGDRPVVGRIDGCGGPLDDVGRGQVTPPSAGGG